VGAFVASSGLMRAHASGAFVCRPSHTRAFSPLSLSSYAAQNWIEEMTGCNLNEGTFADSLKNGIILCKCVRRSLARLARLRACAGITEKHTSPPAAGSPTRSSPAAWPRSTSPCVVRANVFFFAAQRRRL
jgi:hypothetical protein